MDRSTSNREPPEPPGPQKTRDGSRNQNEPSNAIPGSTFLIAAGLFVTAITQPKLIGLLPLRVLLQDKLFIDVKAMAGFFAFSSLAFYLKPLAGLLVDGFPLFGTRRRYYLLLSTAAAALTWLLLIVIPKTYFLLFSTIVIINLFLVIANTVVGGLLAEQGQRQRTTGRLSALFQSIQLITGVIIGPLGGFLASRAFGLTGLTAATLLLLFVPVVWFTLRELPQRRADTDGWSRGRDQLETLLHSRTLWKAGILLFVALFGPGFVTPLYFRQTGSLGFSPQLIGNLGIVSAIAGIIATVIYGQICRKVSLKVLLIAGTLCNVVGICCYLGYTSAMTAILIESAYGLLSTLAILPLLDLAARAAPPGSEGLGFAVMTSLYNVAVNFSDVFGSWLLQSYHLSFPTLLWMDAGTRLLALGVLPLLPRMLLERCDGDSR